MTNVAHDCYGGQWTIHPSHDYEVKLPNWRGGGWTIVTCPGKTRETVLDYRPGITLVCKTHEEFTATGRAPSALPASMKKYPARKPGM